MGMKMHSPHRGMTRGEIARCAARQDSFAWELRQQGLSLKEIAEALGSSPGVANARIRRHKRRHGLTTPAPRVGSRYPLTKAQGQEALSRWQAGESALSLSREYGVAYQTMSRLYRGTIRAWALEGDHFEEARTGGSHIDDARHSGDCQRTRV